MQVFYVRKGRVVGRKGLVVDKVEDVETPALVARVARAALRRRAEATTSRREILVPVEPDDPSSTRSSSRSAAGRKVRVRVPAARRQARAAGDGHAERAARRSRATSCERASDHNARARALVALQEALDLPEAPLRIECFDISNLQGTEIVGVDGGDGRRPAEALRLPALQDPTTTTARTTSRRWRRC